MNDWELRKLLTSVLSLQAIVWCLVFLNYYGIHIPILPALFTLVYLLYVPGVLFLRVFHVHELGDVTSLLYSVGLSLTNVMVVGLLLNTFLPAVGFTTPISIVPIVVTFGLEICILSVLCYRFDKYVPKTQPSNLPLELLSPKVLLLCLIPFLSVFGTYLMNVDNNPALQLLLIIIIAALTIFIGFSSSFQERLYPFSLFVIALSLLYSATLISRFLTGSGDIYQEYFVANLVIQKSLWDSTVVLEMNASAAVTILAPILSIFSGVSLTWLFKVVYPCLFALVPVCLYQVFKKLTNPKIAFFSVLLFVFSSTFYVDLVVLARQQIGELFLALVVLTIVSARFTTNRRRTTTNRRLLLIFAISTILSHYALAFLYIFILLFVWLIVSLSETPLLQAAIKRVLDKLPSGDLQERLSNSRYESTGTSPLSLSFVALFAISTLAWFIYTSRALLFGRVVDSAALIISRMQTDLFAPGSTQGLQVLTATSFGFLQEIARDIGQIQQFLILVGAVALTLRFISTKFTKEYIGLVWMNLGLLAAALIVPSFASQLYIPRLWHITLMFLAPCCIIGVLVLLKGANHFTKQSETRPMNMLPKVLAVFFAITLLFQTGFLYDVVQHQSSSIAFGSTLDSFTYNVQEETGAQWIQRVTSPPDYIFSDLVRYGLIGQYGWGVASRGTNGANFSYFSIDTLGVLNPIPQNATIFLGTYNLMHNTVAVRGQLNTFESTGFPYVALNPLVDNRSRIYDNGGANVYS
jgi:uncharacterized membrane protein